MCRVESVLIHAGHLQGQLCVLAEDCDQPDYKKLVEALCSEHNVSLLSVPEAKQLGQWAGVSPWSHALYRPIDKDSSPAGLKSSCTCAMSPLCTQRVYSLGNNPRAELNSFWMVDQRCTQ